MRWADKETTNTRNTMSAQAAKTIRTALKTELGLNSRRVSVRADSYSMGSSVYVKIKDHTVSFAAVEEIAKRSEHVRRCETTGEILSGGNTYVTVEWSREARVELAAKYVDQAVDAILELEEIKANDDHTTNVLITIKGTDVMIGQASNGYGFQLWNGDTCGMHVDDAQSAAFYTATYEAKRRQSAPESNESEESPMEAWIKREGF